MKAHERIQTVCDYVDSHKKVYEKLFRGDQSCERMFNYFTMKSRSFCTAYIRSMSENGCLQYEFVNSLLNANVVVAKPTPKFDIIFEQDESQETPLFFKKLYSGWCVKLDREVFNRLAYTDSITGETIDTNIHRLIVRGKVFRIPGIDDLVQSKICVVYCCADRFHVGRNEESIRRKEDSADRAKSLKLGHNYTAHGHYHTNSTLKSESQDEDACLVSQVVELVFEDEACYFHDGDDVTNNHLVLAEHSMNEELTCLLVRRINDAVVYNVDSLYQVVRTRLERVSFGEKVQYWGSLRSSEATSEKLLCALFDACLGDGSNNKLSSVVFESAQEVAQQYLREYEGLDPDQVSNKLIQWQSSINLSTGFATGFGGFLTMPFTIPAGLLAAWTTSARLAFAIAFVWGHDVFHPRVCAAVLYCLTGSDKKEDEKEENNESAPEESLRKRLHSKWVLYTGGKSAVVELSLSKIVEHQNEDAADTEKTFSKHFDTLYDILGVEQDATQREIRAAYRRLALKYHPDKVVHTCEEDIDAANKHFQVLGAAYEQLGDIEKRQEYDLKLKQGRWSWNEFTWNQNLDKAREAFENASKQLSEAVLADHHDFSTHAASRAVTKVVFETAEHVGTRGVNAAAVHSFSRMATTVELETSIHAGEKLAARATTSSSAKLIPILGALISGAIDCATTASVGRCSKRVFKVNS
uniref:J domain-containing protein n=1 Tax=Mucochytrium quahogii TaxID=96639 RepID=A0A7S2RY38_9STRA|mmetsp:Transcript_23229/g.36957  ORF Transcript_23229/g.36957 Transcript_23229/m.36957 type:complete len:696 (+) Transcript_23229:449-2536(+)|eukprot:CAMPEP_0203750892 /NCGR_PEP_ID=MMETSP0098-20131031/5045_1 /ASSEMBLY_ACC=CAM_ASM_000208 /TAXON_ID=96639 /ORGANISM=" , Strain NY0313808BC1" /LENGTH=695 /DNA_ID=CAMNT_0050640371 /DNA_START=420 /DNA_END=2507 /DNA_ORIENTATION=+